MRERLSQLCYQRRVVLGNAIAFAGFVAILFDRNASIAPNRLLAGALIGLLGFSLRIWASSYQWHNIARSLPESRTGLITAGPYALMRHPIYAGMILLTAGIFIAFGSWLAVAIAVIPTVLLNYWQAWFEDLGMDHILLNVADPEKSVAHYRKFLGQPMPGNNGRIWFQVGASRVGLLKTPAGGRNGVNHFCVSAAPFNYDAVVGRLRQLGAKVESPEVAGAAEYRDPDGLLVQVMGPR